MKLRIVTLAASVLVFSGGVAVAQQTTAQGPVATACSDDISRFCAGMEHGQGQVRACLEGNKDRVSAACRTALDTTRGAMGQGMGQGMMGQRMGQGMGQRMGQGMMGRGMGKGMRRGMMGRGMHRGAHMRIMFALLDTDGDGGLSLDEVQTAHARIFKAVDTDGDGKVTYEEMVAFFRGGPLGMGAAEDDDDDDSDQ